MGSADAARLIEAIARLVSAIAWPIALVFALIYLRPAVRDFITSLSEVRVKGAGFEASAQRRVTLDADAQKLYDFWKPGGKTDRTNAGRIAACMDDLGIGGTVGWLINAGTPEERARVIAQLSRQERGGSMPIRPDSAYRVATAYVHSETIDLGTSEIVGRVTQDFIDSGAAQVEVEPDGDGAWKIIAMFRHRP